MTPRELFAIRARQHQSDAELLAALQLALDELEKMTEQRNTLAAPSDATQQEAENGRDKH